MKKLALAFMCLVSVAFFASCNKPVENPEPSISVMSGENFINGTTENPTIIDINSDNLYDLKVGFHVESNAQTKKELSSLKITVNVNVYPNGETYSYTADTTISLAGKTEYDFITTIFEAEDRNIVEDITFTALVTDVDNHTNTATIAFKIDQTATPLVATEFDWYRLGNTQTGLEEYGLYWERNAKSPFAQIKPLTGVTLYSFSADKWEATTTNLEKAALFADGAISMTVYNNVDVNQNSTYNDVIGTVMPDGTMHLLHVTSCTIGAQQTEGRPIHIYGQAK